MEDRVIELETKLAFQEDLLQELNSIVTQQQREIAQMHQMIKNIQAQIHQLSPSPVASQSEESPPPHY